jgi:hypothetical protein
MILTFSGVVQAVDSESAALSLAKLLLMAKSGTQVQAALCLPLIQLAQRILTKSNF